MGKSHEIPFAEQMFEVASTDHQDMPRYNDVGLFLFADNERSILQAAALACGLDTVDLSPAASASLTPLPSLIVTDQPTGPWDPAYHSAFAAFDAPTLLRISDPDPAAAPPAHATNAFALERPLRLESATAALQQASAMRHYLLDRHSSLVDDLDHCRRIFDSVTNGISISDATLPDFPLTYVNPAFELISGYTSSEVCGRNCRFLQGAETQQPALLEIRRALREGTDARVVLRNFRKDGTPFWNELYLSTIRDRDGRITHFVGIQNDITLQVEATNQLQFLAQHDPLTGLANRAFLMARLDQALQQARRNQSTVAVLYFDLDKFKEVNDTLGHDAGDQLLLVVAERLRSATRGGETVARLGGDEFVVVLEDVSADRQPLTLMRRLVENLQQPANILGTELYPCASAGLAIFPQDGETAEALLKTADFKMYLVKHNTHAVQQLPQQPPISSHLNLVPQLTR